MPLLAASSGVLNAEFFRQPMGGISVIKPKYLPFALSTLKSKIRT